MHMGARSCWRNTQFSPVRHLRVGAAGTCLPEAWLWHSSITIMSVVIELEVSAATLRSTESHESRGQIVNRTRNGDRQVVPKDARQIKFERTLAPIKNWPMAVNH